MSADDLRVLVSTFREPEVHANMLRVVAAEAARRRGWVQTCSAIMTECKNATLGLAWRTWAEERPSTSRPE